MRKFIDFFIKSVQYKKPKSLKDWRDFFNGFPKAWAKWKKITAAQEKLNQQLGRSGHGAA